MPTTKLTQTSVAKIVASTKSFVVFDTELPGFGVRAFPSGAKSYVVEYRPNGGGRRSATRRMTIGPTTTFTCERARGVAKDVLARVRLGADPAGERQVDRKAATIEELSVKFLAPNARANIKPRTLELYGSYFRNHVNPRIGRKRAQDT